MDAADAASVLRETLKLPKWVGSIPAWELDDTETVVIRVEQRYARTRQNVPRIFEAYPVAVRILSSTPAGEIRQAFSLIQSGAACGDFPDTHEAAQPAPVAQIVRGR